MTQWPSHSRARHPHPQTRGLCRLQPKFSEFQRRKAQLYPIRLKNNSWYERRLIRVISIATCLVTNQRPEMSQNVGVLSQNRVQVHRYDGSWFRILQLIVIVLVAYEPPCYRQCVRFIYISSSVVSLNIHYHLDEKSQPVSAPVFISLYRADFSSSDLHDLCASW